MMSVFRESKQPNDAMCSQPKKPALGCYGACAARLSRRPTQRPGRAREKCRGPPQSEGGRTIKGKCKEAQQLQLSSPSANNSRAGLRPPPKRHKRGRASTASQNSKHNVVAAAAAVPTRGFQVGGLGHFAPRRIAQKEGGGAGVNNVRRESTEEAEERAAEASSGPEPPAAGGFCFFPPQSSCGLLAIPWVKTP